MHEEKKEFYRVMSLPHKFCDGEIIIISGLKYPRNLNKKFTISNKKISLIWGKNDNKI